MTGPNHVTAEHQQRLGGVFLLEHMVHEDRTFPLLLEGEDQPLEPLLEWLHQKSYVEIVDDDHYAATETGRKVLSKFLERYEDFLRTLDIYSAVDLEEGSFAFERIFDFEDDRDWHEYLDQERFSDLRVAVAEFKKLDPVELVFMACVNDGTLSVEEPGWQSALMHGDFWAHVEEVIQNALRPADLAFEDDQGRVEGEDVLRQVIIEGAELNLELKKEEARREAEEEREEPTPLSPAESQVVEEVTVTRYEAYVDPYYVSPVWLGLWLL